MLRARWFERLDFRKFDLVISVSAAEAKGIKVPLYIPHINYCNAPTHYYWSRYQDYLKNPGFGALDPIARIGLKILLKGRRKWDLQAAKRPQFMIGNSKHIVAEIKKYYGCDATVIHPPVDIERFIKTKPAPRKGFVIAGRQTPYKRIDLAVAAATKLGVPLTVIGNGPEHDKLVTLAGKTVSFKTQISDDEMSHYFQSASAFLFPGIDDFGITPVEAMAAGCPVIAFRGGGALDYVIPGKTGLFFDDQTVDTLAAAMTKSLNTAWPEAEIAKKAVEFGPKVFRATMSAFISQVLD